MGLNLLKDLKPRQPVGVFYFYLVLSKLMCIFITMKKYILVLAVIVSVTMAACGSKSTSNETTDSTSTNIDSTAVSADSTTAQIPTDSTVTK